MSAGSVTFRVYCHPSGRTGFFADFEPGDMPVAAYHGLSGVGPVGRARILAEQIHAPYTRADLGQAAREGFAHGSGGAGLCYSGATVELTDVLDGARDYARLGRNEAAHVAPLVAWLEAEIARGE